MIFQSTKILTGFSRHLQWVLILTAHSVVHILAFGILSLNLFKPGTILCQIWLCALRFFICILIYLFCMVLIQVVFFKLSFFLVFSIHNIYDICSDQKYVINHMGFLFHRNFSTTEWPCLNWDNSQISSLLTNSTVFRFFVIIWAVNIVAYCGYVAIENK